MIVVVPCSGRKLDRPAPARELYVGSYHRACMAAAERLLDGRGLPHRILVMSARHGLVTLDQVVEPYDLRWSSWQAASPSMMVAQAQLLGAWRSDRVVLLGGREYVERGLVVWDHAETPLAGLGGIGEHLRVLKTLGA